MSWPSAFAARVCRLILVAPARDRCCCPAAAADRLPARRAGPASQPRRNLDCHARTAGPVGRRPHAAERGPRAEQAAVRAGVRRPVRPRAGAGGADGGPHGPGHHRRDANDGRDRRPGPARGRVHRRPDPAGARLRRAGQAAWARAARRGRGPELSRITGRARRDRAGAPVGADRQHPLARRREAVRAGPERPAGPGHRRVRRHALQPLGAGARGPPAGRREVRHHIRR